VIARVVALAVLACGLALLAMMVVTEGEPGALPLLLVLLGGGGYAVERYRSARRRRAAR
jgi:hypothetical protein